MNLQKQLTAGPLCNQHQVKDENQDRNKFHLGVRLSGTIGTRYDIPHILIALILLSITVGGQIKLEHYKLCSIDVLDTFIYEMLSNLSRNGHFASYNLRTTQKADVSILPRPAQNTPRLLSVVFSKLIMPCMDTKNALLDMVYNKTP